MEVAANGGAIITMVRFVAARTLCAGLVGLLAGIAVLAYPGLSLLTLVLCLGLGLVAYGLTTVVRGLRTGAVAPTRSGQFHAPAGWPLTAAGGRGDR